MQIRQQIIDLLLREHLSVPWHLVTAITDHVRCPVVIRRHSAAGEILAFERTLKAWALAFPGRIGRVTAIAILVVDVAARSLLRSEGEFCVASSALDFAAETG